jgi:hypothetical protein
LRTAPAHSANSGLRQAARTPDKQASPETRFQSRISSAWLAEHRNGTGSCRLEATPLFLAVDTPAEILATR